MGRTPLMADTAPGSSVLIVDAEPVFADGLRNLLLTTSNLRCRATANRAREVLPSCARTRPDIVLLDAALDPAAFLIATMKRLNKPPAVAVLLTEIQLATGYLERCISAGADLVLPRAIPGGELLGGIDRVRRGTPVVHPSLAGHRSAIRRVNEPVVALTQRQFEVLCLMADGKGNEVIAEELFVAAETVRTHVKGIRHALKAVSRAHAVSRAFQIGLLPVERLAEARWPEPTEL